MHDALGHGSQRSLPLSIGLKGLNLSEYGSSMGLSLTSLGSGDDVHCLTFLSTSRVAGGSDILSLDTGANRAVNGQ